MNTEEFIKLVETKADLERISETLKDMERGFIPQSIVIRDILFYLGLIDNRFMFVGRKEKIGSNK